MDIFVENCYNRIRNGYLERCNINEELHIGRRGVFYVDPIGAEYKILDRISLLEYLFS
jgi:hypothetical protein